MSVQSISHILKKVHALPPLPAAVERLCQLTSDTEADLDEIVHVLESDEALTSKVLRVANSAFYGFSEKVGDISQAIVVMGIQGVKSLAVGVAFYELGAEIPANSRLSREQIWRHSLSGGCAARMLAEYFKLENWKEAFVGGLLHDIGKIVFMKHFTDEYNQVLEEAENSWKPLKFIECEVFGIHHAAVGAELCQYWRLPASLISMVYDRDFSVNRKAPLSDRERMICAVLLGDNLARMSGIGTDGDPQMAAEFMDVMEAERISSRLLRQFLSDLPEEVHKAETFFKLTSESPLSATPHTPSAVGLVLGSERDMELVRIMLLAIGFAPVSLAEVEEGNTPLAGVVIDDSVEPGLKSRLQERNVPLLDYAQWHRENFSTGHAEQQLNIVRLEAWLNSSLTGK
jgi:putative nucleotidyltransferase with HDIG domain